MLTGRGEDTGLGWREPAARDVAVGGVVVTCGSREVFLIVAKYTFCVRAAWNKQKNTSINVTSSTVISYTWGV